MMNAIEARKKAIEVLKEHENEEALKTLNGVYYEIHKAVHKGALSVNIKVNYDYQDFILYSLNEDGYKVEILFENFKISW